MGTGPGRGFIRAGGAPIFQELLRRGMVGVMQYPEFGKDFGKRDFTGQGRTPLVLDPGFDARLIEDVFQRLDFDQI